LSVSAFLGLVGRVDFATHAVASKIAGRLGLGDLSAPYFAAPQRSDQMMAIVISGLLLQLVLWASGVERSKLPGSAVHSDSPETSARHANKRASGKDPNGGTDAFKRGAAMASKQCRHTGKQRDDSLLVAQSPKKSDNCPITESQ